MINLKVYIEIKGREVHVGNILGEESSSAKFQYSDSYLSADESRPISVSLKLQEEPFSELQTQNYFNGLLPEGFMRQSIANAIHVNNEDYLSVLSFLGKECLGAIRIGSNDSEDAQSPRYIALELEEIEALAKEGATKSTEIVAGSHISLTGASGKVGLFLNEKDGRWYQPFGSAPSTHIVKQSHIRLNRIVTNEQLSLLTAKKLGIKIPESFILDACQEDNTLLFASKRYDRMNTSLKEKIDGQAPPLRLHQEDMAQALGIPSVAKYETNNGGYLKKMFTLIATHSSNPIEQQMNLWDLCIFNYLIGNTDNHIKNISLLYNEDLSKMKLAPAYDIISTIIYEASSKNMAISIGGEHNIEKIEIESFMREARNLGLGNSLARDHFERLASLFKMKLEEAATELADTGFHEAIEIKDEIINTRKIK